MSTQIPTELIAGNVKAAMKTVDAGSSDLWKIEPGKIKTLPGFQPRDESPEYLAHLAVVKESIKANGFYAGKPLSIFVATENGEQSIYVYDGHTRLRAVLELIAEGVNIETVPAVAAPKGTNMEDLMVSTVTMQGGRPLTPFEVAKRCKVMIDMGIDEKVICKRLGMTKVYLTDLLTLVGAPKAIRDMVAAGQVAATTAVKELKAHGPKAVVRLKEAMTTATAAGKTKVTGKHIGKKPGAAPSLKLKGKISVKHKVGATEITIVLDGPLDVELVKGNLARIVITEDGEL